MSNHKFDSVKINKMIKYIKSDARPNEVNNDRKLNEVPEEIIELIKEVTTEKEYNSIYEINIMNLSDNIEPHDDESFIGSGIKKDVILVCLKSETNCSAKFDQIPRNNHLYHSKKFEEIDCPEGFVDVIKFDASKEHAMMVSKNFVGFGIWFRKGRNTKPSKFWDQI